MIDQKMNGSSLASTSKIKTKQTAENSDNIYDIICYYDDNNDEESVGNVNDVINKIEKANNGTRNNSRNSDKSYLHWKLFGCLIINVRMFLVMMIKGESFNKKSLQSTLGSPFIANLCIWYNLFEPKANVRC